MPDSSRQPFNASTSDTSAAERPAGSEAATQASRVTNKRDVAVPHVVSIAVAVGRPVGFTNRSVHDVDGVKPTGAGTHESDSRRQ